MINNLLSPFCKVYQVSLGSTNLNILWFFLRSLRMSVKLVETDDASKTSAVCFVCTYRGRQVSGRSFGVAQDTVTHTLLAEGAHMRLRPPLLVVWAMRSQDALRMRWLHSQLHWDLSTCDQITQERCTYPTIKIPPLTVACFWPTASDCYSASDNIIERNLQRNKTCSFTSFLDEPESY